MLTFPVLPFVTSVVSSTMFQFTLTGLDFPISGKSHIVDIAMSG